MIKRGIKIMVCMLLIYIILGAILPLLRHKQVPESARQSFHPADCYAEETGTERVLCIDDNLEALLWRIRVIETAQEEIILSTFDFGNDESGQDMMALLLHAADRGVSVRLLVDGANGVLKLSGSPYFQVLMSHPNIEVKFYNPVDPLLPWKMTLRLHDKYLIADQSVYILGGRNTNDLFLGNYRENYNIDKELLVYETDLGKTESSMSQLRGYFAEIWSLSDNKDMIYSREGQKTESAASDLQFRYHKLREIYPEAFMDTDYYENTMETNKITLLTNVSEPVNKEPGLWYMLHSLMSEGKEIVIQTPYVICSKEMYEDLQTLCNGAKVELIINAVESGANPWGCTDYLNEKDRIQKTGMEIYELMGEQSRHTKMILIDDRLSIVGSFNLDMRSAYLDTEMMLAVDCKQLSRNLHAAVEQDRIMSRHLYPDGTCEYGELYEPRELSFRKKAFYGILRIATRPIRHLL